MELKHLKFTNPNNLEMLSFKKGKIPEISKSILAVFFLIIVLASFLRLYKLDTIPPSLSWDEAATGYNAWSIANYGKDEWGNSFPLFFKSFEDDKHPVHIYVTAISVKLLGLTEYSTRLPAALLGVANVALLFFLARIFFKSNFAGLLASFSLAISPYNLQFSRFNHELNFVMFFFMLGLLFFYKGLQKKNFLLILSFLSFGITLLAYHSPKVVLPPLILLLVGLYFKELLKIKRYFLSALLVLGFFGLIIALNPQLLGLARANQTAYSKEQIQKTDLYSKTQNEILGRVDLTWHEYLKHFTPEYLYISGDGNARHSSQAIGEFYIFEVGLLIMGALFLLLSRSKIAIILLAWALLAPLPAALVGGSPHAARAMFTTGSWHLILAFGAYRLFQLLKKRYLIIPVLLILLAAYGWYLKDYLTYYYQDYSKKYAIEWQYGMKQIAEFVKKHPEYDRVFMTDVRSQPYIFFLYYLQIPLDTLKKTVIYNQAPSRGYNLIYSFGRYQFGGWDEIDSRPDSGLLYIVEPSKYSGLRFKQDLGVDKLIKFPGGGDAFYIVSKI